MHCTLSPALDAYSPRVSATHRSTVTPCAEEQLRLPVAGTVMSADALAVTAAEYPPKLWIPLVAQAAGLASSPIAETTTAAATTLHMICLFIGCPSPSAKFPIPLLLVSACGCPVVPFVHRES